MSDVPKRERLTLKDVVRAFVEAGFWERLLILLFVLAAAGISSCEALNAFR